MMGIIIVICAVYSLVVAPYFVMILSTIYGTINQKNWLRFLNLYWLYSNTNLNWIGAVVVAIFINILTCPLSVVYWIYKSFVK